MTEALLQFAWKYRLYTQLTPLGELADEGIEIIDPGILNQDAGADFFNAKIKVGSIVWAGDVEIHHDSKQWIEHGHDRDPRYSSVILHVVLNHSREVYDNKGRNLPTCLMHLSPDLYERTKLLQEQAESLPCAKAIKGLTDRERSEWLEAMVRERLALKALSVRAIWDATAQDWRETIYRHLMSYFGFSLNNASMERLARSLPFRHLLKHRDHPIQIEALLIGQAGLLGELPKCIYRSKLEAEYSFLSHKYGLSPLPSEIWRKARTRPQNFPLRRILQISSLIRMSGTLSLDFFLNIRESRDLAPLFVSEALSPESQEYLDEVLGSSGLSMGRKALDLLLINVIVPLLLGVSEILIRPELKGTAEQILEDTAAESNKITRLFTMQGLRLRHAQDSQACIHIYKSYCLQRKCLFCSLGRRILSHPIDQILE